MNDVSGAGRRIRLTVAYDGTDFSGWQIQSSARTVQGEMHRSLERMHGHPVRLEAAGRTDAGVHARGQVVSLTTDLDSIPVETLPRAINSFLPVDVRIMAAQQTAPEFHARFSARSRTYRYYLYPTEIGYPHLRRHCLLVRQAPDIDRLTGYADCLIGSRDYTTFAATGGDHGRSMTRRVLVASWYELGDFLVFEITANAFLWKMVRSIVGTMIDLEAAAAGRDEMEAIIAAADRRRAGPTAPARGLFLEHVGYDDGE